jgi:Spy/CpxP family protein refolding chaperone
MQTIKIYLLLALLVTFAAGIAGGVMFAPRREPPKQQRGGPISRIVDELKLSPDQHDKVMAVFRKAMSDAPPPPFEKFRDCDKKRDCALDALLTEQQREQAARINAEFEKEIEELNAPGMACFKQAQAETRELLTPEQQVQFDKLIAEKMPSFRGRWKGQPGAGARDAQTQPK